MKKLRRNIHLGVILVACVLATIVSACDKEKEPIDPVNPDRFDTVVLVYAASGNNLYYNMLSDKSEMLEGLARTNINKTRLLVLETVPESETRKRRVVLYEATKRSNKFQFKELKEFSPDVYTTDPARMKEVVAYMTDNYKADKYGLILWSHGGAWDPYQSSARKAPSIGGYGQTTPPEEKWWGDDKIDNKNDRMNIDELAEALPDHLFHFIWFDCCYMSNIETIYQLRNKCRYLAAYPTEIYNPGMNYADAVPALLRTEPDLKLAAKTLYDYYTGPQWTAATPAVTVGVFDMSAIEGVAAVARKAFSAYSKPEASGLIRYSRGGVSPLYDFRQTVESVASASGVNLDSHEIDDAFGRFTVVKYASECDFDRNPIPANHFSGLSTHLFDPESSSSSEAYYRSLDWFGAVFTAN